MTPFDPQGPAGLLLAAPRSGSGKTLVTLGLAAALSRRGVRVAPAKSGPDYIDTALLAKVAPAISLDAWAMSVDSLRARAAAHAGQNSLLLIEGAMGLFDGAADGTGSTADLAAALELPVILLVDAERQGQSVAALVHGFAHFRSDIAVAGLILNRVASPRHERMLKEALTPLSLPVLGAIPRDAALHLPSRHLGLVLPGEVDAFDNVVANAAKSVADHIDLDAVLALAGPLARPQRPSTRLTPLGQHVAIASDAAFAFLYRHLCDDFQQVGARLSFFSPLANEAPAADADAVFLPGGYPELHGPALAAADRFRAGLAAAVARGALVYGECGGYMVLGEGLIDQSGQRHRMAGLLPISTDMSHPIRHLGYRRLAHNNHLPWPTQLNGHEFHYSSELPRDASVPPLFAATTADGETLAPMGAVVGRTMGSYAHVIDVAVPR